MPVASKADHILPCLPAEVNNLVGNRAKKMKLEGRHFAVPDSIVLGSVGQNALETSLDAEQMVRFHFLLGRQL